MPSPSPAPDLLATVRRMLRWSQRVLYFFAAVGALAAVGLVLSSDSLGTRAAAGAALAFGALMGWLGSAAPDKNPVMRALRQGAPKLTKVSLGPYARIHGTPEQVAEAQRHVDYAVTFFLDHQPAPGMYRLPRDESQAFIAQLLAHDETLVIEAEDPSGDVYRLAKTSQLR